MYTKDIFKNIVFKTTIDTDLFLLGGETHSGKGGEPKMMDMCPLPLHVENGVSMWGRGAVGTGKAWGGRRGQR